MGQANQTKANQLQAAPGRLAIPDRKISETIIDFGAPLIFDLDKKQPIDIIRATFTIVIMVWNAQVMAMPVWGKPELLEQVKDLLGTPKAAAEARAAYNELTARRLEHFANDPRAVGNWHVAFDANGRLRLHCEAHVPPSLMPRRG